MDTLLERDEEKTERMNIRLTPSEKSLYEEAARVRGQKLSQWTVSHLDRAARADIEEAERVRLSPVAYDAFVRALETEYMPEKLAELLGEDPGWA